MRVDADAAMGGILRRMRVEAGFTTESAARELKMGPRRLCDVEDGEEPLYFAELLDLMTLYGSSVTAFVLRVGAEVERLAQDRAR